MTLVTMHEFDADHLAEIMEEAKEIGSVTINVYFDGETYHALEGVHRTEAAKQRGLPIILITREWDEMIESDCDDIWDRDENNMASVGQIMEYAYSTRIGGQVYNEDDFVSVEVR